MTEKEKKAIKLILYGAELIGWEVAIPTYEKCCRGVVIGTDEFITKLDKFFKRKVKRLKKL